MADEHGVTYETIRKDLMLLESRRLLRRVHGEAMPMESLSFEPSINERTTMAAEKERIATAAGRVTAPEWCGAVRFGHNNGGPRRQPAPRVIAGRGHQLVADCARVDGLSPADRAHARGARSARATSATVDSWALRQLRDVRTDIAFVGTNAFSLSHGLSAPDAAEAAVKGAMVESARLTVLLADHTKFGREAMFRYADLRAIDVLVADDGMSESDARSLMTAADIEVLCV